MKLALRVQLALVRFAAWRMTRASTRYNRAEVAYVVATSRLEASERGRAAVQQLEAKNRAERRRVVRAQRRRSS